MSLYVCVGFNLQPLARLANLTVVRKSRHCATYTSPYSYIGFFSLSLFFNSCTGLHCAMSECIHPISFPELKSCCLQSFGMPVMAQQYPHNMLFLLSADRKTEVELYCSLLKNVKLTLFGIVYAYTLIVMVEFQFLFPVWKLRTWECFLPCDYAHDY